jgi:two-component system nitrogen regulation response regulator NtrX
MKKPLILLVDDEEAIIESLGGSLEDEGYAVLTAQDGVTAMNIIKTKPIDMVFLDIWLPGMDGLETLKAIKDFDPNLDVIIMTGHGTVNTAVQAVKMGAFDFLEKPFSLDTIIEIIGKAQKKRQVSQKNIKDLVSEQPEIKETLIGDTPSILAIKEMITKFGASNANILIQGESGTGKELVARLIHLASDRKDRPMKKFNCASFLAEEVEIELFGYQGSKAPLSKKDGALLDASESTIFVDGIDLLPFKVQKRLATFLKSLKKKSLNVRLIAASEKNMKNAVKEGRFYKKLFEDLNHAIIKMPAMRERRGDIPKLLSYFLTYFCNRYEQSEKIFDDEALETLINYDWSGNIKELKNMVEKIVVTVPTTLITLHDIPVSVRNEMDKDIQRYYERYTSMQEAEDVWKRNYLLYHLNKNDRNIKSTAERLRISESRLQNYIGKFGIVLAKRKKARKTLQRTLKRSMVLSGRGLHSGLKTGIILSPLPPNSGIIFDSISNSGTIPALIDYVESTEYATTLRKGNVTACTVEHFLAVLHAYRISNLLIKINNEVPIMDGSAVDFCQLIEDAGIEEQDAFLEEIVIPERYSVGEATHDSRYIYIEPSDEFSIHYILQYPDPVGHQEYAFTLMDGETFKDEIAPARTFGFLKDIEMLEKRGLASGGRLNNFILIDDEKIINTELRFPDEFVRHKILDLLGDFYLLGRPIRGKIVANMTGHTQNNTLLRIIRESLHLL